MNLSRLSLLPLPSFTGEGGGEGRATHAAGRVQPTPHPALPRRRGKRGCYAVALSLLLAAPLHAETVKLAVGQKGFWDTSIAVWGERAGFFKQEGLDLEVLYTDGGAQTQQAVISGGVQVGIATGSLGVLAAAVKGAPVRIIEAEWHGASDLFWYARTDGAIHTMKDAGGHTAAFSAAGSSSNLVLLALLAQAGVKAQPTPTGGAGATLTQVMSGQIEIGWSVPPIGLAEEKAGRIRIVGRGTDIPALADQTTRVNIANATWLKEHRDVAVRFARAYDRSLAFAYSDPKAIEWYAEGMGIDTTLARQVRDTYYPAPAMQDDVMKGLDATLRDMIAEKRVPAGTTVDQLKPAIDLLPGAAP